MNDSFHDGAGPHGAFLNLRSVTCIVMYGACAIIYMCVWNTILRGGSTWGGGVSGVANPSPNGQSYNIKCRTSDVLSHGITLIYIAKKLVVVLIKF